MIQIGEFCIVKQPGALDGGGRSLWIVFAADGETELFAGLFSACKRWAKANS